MGGVSVRGPKRKRAECGCEPGAGRVRRLRFGGGCVSLGRQAATCLQRGRARCRRDPMGREATKKMTRSRDASDLQFYFYLFLNFRALLHIRDHPQSTGNIEKKREKIIIKALHRLYFYQVRFQSATVRFVNRHDLVWHAEIRLKFSSLRVCVMSTIEHVSSTQRAFLFSHSV